MDQFKISFWNYVKMGVLEAKKAVQDWQDAGFNLAMTFEYNSEKDTPSQMLELLDECQKKNIKASSNSISSFNYCPLHGKEIER